MNAGSGRQKAKGSSCCCTADRSVLSLRRQKAKESQRCSVGVIVVFCAVVCVIGALLFWSPMTDSYLLLQLSWDKTLLSDWNTTSDLVSSVSSSFSSSSSSSSSFLPRGELRGELRRHNAEQIWESLIKRGAAAVDSGTGGIQRIMEVGMHRPKQCLQAATAGLEAHCVEPSPMSFPFIKKTVDAQPETIRKRIHLYENAAGDTSGQIVEFMSGGSTGDHVGNADMWGMKNEAPTDPEILKKSGTTVKVSTIRIDDIVKDQQFSLIKVDTQGFEPAVFSGLHQTLAMHKADYILTEFWPKGMDLIFIQNVTTITNTTRGRCQKSVEILELLWQNGYRIYPLSVSAHPRAPLEARRHPEQRPLDDFMSHCMWYYNMEELFPSDVYHMGYWSDMLAVAPGMNISFL